MTRFGRVLFIIGDERIRFYHNEIDTNNFLKKLLEKGGGWSLNIFLQSKFAYKDFLAFDVHGKWVSNEQNFICSSIYGHFYKSISVENMHYVIITQADSE